MRNVRKIKINESSAISNVVMLIIREAKGIFSYKRVRRKKLRKKNEIVIRTGRNIAGFSPSLVSPQGIWLKRGITGGREK